MYKRVVARELTMINHKKLCLLVVIAASLVLIFVSCVGQPERQSSTPATPQASADWSMFHFGLDHCGYNDTENVLKPPLELKWRYQANSGAKANSSPALVNDTIYFGSGDRFVYALDAGTGNLKWSYETGSDVFSSPAVEDGLVYIGSYDGKLYALKADTGELVWSYQTGDEVRSSPAVADGMVYAGSHDFSMYALDAKKGELVWSFKTGSLVSSSPAVVGGVVYFGSLDGIVYALEATMG